MRRFHDEPTAGHLGVAKTIARIARHCYWPGMFRDIARYVRNCTSCIAHKAYQGKPAGFAHAHPVNAPWQQVSADLVGPLPRSTNGHCWLLNIQDRFTKWVEMLPLRKATGSAIAGALLERIIYRHGCPDSLISDNGRQFLAKPVQDVLKEFGIRHRKTPTYTPQCNPVERTNRTLKTMIRQFIDRNHRHWDRHLAALQYAYNMARHEATGFTPAYLNHGRELASPHPDDRSRKSTGVPPAANRRRLEEAYEVVRINLAHAFQRQEPHYNLRKRD